jgi:hypothetical protein
VGVFAGDFHSINELPSQDFVAASVLPTASVAWHCEDAAIGNAAKWHLAVTLHDCKTFVNEKSVPEERVAELR